MITFGLLGPMVGLVVEKNPLKNGNGAVMKTPVGWIIYRGLYYADI